MNESTENLTFSCMNNLPFILQKIRDFMIESIYRDNLNLRSLVWVISRVFHRKSRGVCKQELGKPYVSKYENSPLYLNFTENQGVYERESHLPVRELYKRGHAAQPVLPTGRHLCCRRDAGRTTGRMVGRLLRQVRDYTRRTHKTYT